MRIYTIGFAQKPAKLFFELLIKHEISRIIDIRLNPGGQLAGFTKQQDLKYFLAELINADYFSIPELAPTSEILKDYRQDKNWDNYVRRFEALMDDRVIPDSLDRHLFEEKNACLLCSEVTSDKCHRRLVAERIKRAWPDVNITHL